MLALDIWSWGVRTECVACRKGIEAGVADHEPLTITAVHQKEHLQGRQLVRGASGPPELQLE